MKPIIYLYFLKKHGGLNNEFWDDFILFFKYLYTIELKDLNKYEVEEGVGHTFINIHNNRCEDVESETHLATLSFHKAIDQNFFVTNIGESLLLKYDKDLEPIRRYESQNNLVRKHCMSFKGENETPESCSLCEFKYCETSPLEDISHHSKELFNHIFGNRSKSYSK